MENTPSVMPATVDNDKVAHFPTRVKRRGHRLTLADAEAIADLVAKRASESEACAVLGIPYSTWAHWKAKPHNAEKYGEVLARIRGGKIKAHLENIESFSRKDWRASECYLEKTMPEKFSNKASVEVHTNITQYPDSWFERVEAMSKAKPPVVSSAPAPKQIQDVEIVSPDESKPV